MRALGSNLVDQGYAAIPCRPGSKIPGVYRVRRMDQRNRIGPRFCERLPTATETEIWSKWPDAGVCVALGFETKTSSPWTSTRMDPAIVAAIKSALGDISFVQKAGRKGRTLFYRAGPAVVSTRSASTASACSTCFARASRPSYRRQSTKTPAALHVAQRLA